ncbi:hypothetical protein H8958_006926 [Nasalis larvatus]
MKVKMLSRNPDNYVRETKLDLQRVPRNYDPTLHPFEVPREYVRIWNLTQRNCIRTVQAHEGFVRGICTRFCGTSFFTVGDDKTVKQWKMDGPGYGEEEEPLHTILGKVILDMRTNTICWNPMEAFIFTAANEDYKNENICLQCLYCNEYQVADTHVVISYHYSVRRKKNYGYLFSIHISLYTFDMRALDTPVMVHMDHVSAVLDVDYSPTGKEFVSASFDKSIRIFPVDKSRSREVYHTKRMQHVICVKWTSDSKYIMCGSDEMNIRLWKANASEKLGVLTSREKAAKDYNQKLKEKFQHYPHIKRIARHRHLPKSIYSQIQEQRIMKEARRRKEVNRIKHSKPGSVPIVSEKKKHIVAVVK